MALDKLTQITTSGINSTTPLSGINVTGIITASSLSVSGITTGAAATFDSVDVLGVLTYDDVTNVDALGIVTARSGVRVTGGVTVGTGATLDGSTNVITASTNGSERLRITSGGNIGINTDVSNNPSGSKLVVGGRIQSNAGGYWFAGANGAEDGWHVQDSGGNLLVVESGVAERLRITSAGQLNLAGNMQFTAADPELEFNNGGPRFRVPAANTLTIHTGGGLGATSNERLRINSSGNVGIGTDDPTEKLYVNGTTRLGGGLDYGSTTILNVAPGVVKWDTSGVSGGRLNADQNGNWYLNNKSYPVYDSLGVNMNDIYGANNGAGNIGGWVYLGSTQHSAPYPRKAYKISAPNANQGTFVYQVWFNGDANYEWGGLYEIRINNWSESSRFTSVAVTCINGDSDGLRVYAYNNSNGIWVTVNAIWGSLYIRKFGYDDGQRSRGSSLCAVDNGAYLAQADVNGTSGTIPSGYTEVHANDSGGGGYDIENNHRFQAGQGSP